jgi:colanic acid/amylovoran biosynthesis glycosyltransferase
LRSAPAARFLAVSANLADRLRAFGMPPERTFVHHLGVDPGPSPADDRPERGDAIRVVMVGRFRRSKGHALALQGFAAFAAGAPGATLDLIGAPNRPEQERVRDDLAALVRAQGLERRVRFLGALTAGRVREELATADVALQPSIFVPAEGQVEGVPSVILEAMAAGLPVVATRHGGIPEAVLHERTGLLVDEHDAGAIAAALARLAASASLRHAFGRAGRRHVATDFDHDRQSARLAAHVTAMRAAYAALGMAARTEWEACLGDVAAA